MEHYVAIVGSNIEFFIRPNFLTPSSHFLEFLNDGKNEKSFESYFFRI
ncbi:hypothetical protein LEP1GSC034_3410 [Leptospira interrogans str. 2003000735]|uniref:Uncharacterized protein n=2 Tax=Leptospira interrogans TaxID=173 RepID=A0A829DAP6_LEPIR|nr:hypothetical protein LEP1GSC027_1433 [Leptospira interrogans str. 2002000624]EKQ36371.1 hypothetical protein LEP1GSC025_3228 [Leptospira interrogans str. 2002000621]EKQ45809.1 hypothetical protein LEP1GSC026_1615 [Leptospira interrogans str. 2002000623]EMJ53800.1 hypothetical protein LEP1GSC013_1468 [Leptospira interrogans serovar Valbuzzi str. Duyster]EMJ72393.1 hypothetical protein LEP1GSC034_3410 [Leptospira interrogans str. 2003000735]EMJ76472.1 hypothetical protein LEP1GSC033_1663 [Lep